MKASFFYIHFISFLCISLLLLPSKFYAQFSVKLYNVNDGLPSTNIYGGYQDKYGYLWVSSPAGLSRFDGRQFINYGLTDGLPSLDVVRIFQDSRGRLWIGTVAGMAQFKNNKFITYPVSDNIPNAWVFNFIETKDKRIWVLTGKGVYEFGDSIWRKITLYPGFENSMCRSIIELNGELYVNYPTDIVCRNKEGKWMHIASDQNYGSIFNVMSLQNNEIWVSTNKNIYIVRNHQLFPVFKKNLTGRSFFSYLVDSKKRLWLVGRNFLKTSKPGDWQHFSNSIINKYAHAFSVQEDLSHNIWMGSAEGLLKIKDIAFTTIDNNNTTPLDGIYNMVALPDNRLLFSSGTKIGIQVYENNKFKQIKPPQSTGNENYYRDPIDAYTFDDNHSLWMVTRYRKFLHFNGNTLEDFSSALHLKTTELIYDLDYVKSRHQFFVCADSTLLYGNSANFSIFIPHNTGIPIIKPTRIHLFKNGLLLLNINRQGLYCIDTANNLISLIKESGIDDNKGVQSAVSFCEESNNDFWIAAPGIGLYEYGITKNKIPLLKIHIAIKDGLQSNNILSITNDWQNRLWVATNTGIDILQKNKTGSWEVFNYAKAEELNINISSLEKLVTDTAGNVWLSSPNKIIKFNADAIKLNKEAPHIVIEKVLLSFKETDWSKPTDSLYSYYQLPYNPILTYNQNSLGISFNAIDLSTSNSSPEYSYKLLPLDTFWSSPFKTKSVSFAQLPEGKYQFMVRAKDRASGWSRPAVLQFTITPPFWNRWWFRLLIILMAAIIIISIFRARVQKIRHDAFIENQLKELEMKALKAQMNPHFIYNALNSIQALIANDKKDEGIHYIGSFSRLLRQVLDNSENNVISLDKELETIGLYIQLEALRLDVQLQYKKMIPQEVVTEFEKIPPLILQPFVENALWHGLSRKQGEKEIKITISIKEDWLICDVTDNGIGREKAQEFKSKSALLHQSKAIDITRKRLNDFNEDNSVSPIEFFDLYNAEGTACGTNVMVHIKRKGGSISV